MQDAFGREKRPEDIVVDMVTSKFDDINANIQKIFAWQKRAESRIAEVESSFEELKHDFASVQEQIIAKARTYNDTIVDFRSSMIAFDRLLGKLSPLVARSVNDLQITTQRFKEDVVQRDL